MCGAGGNLIYPPLFCPGETRRWSRVIFLQLLIFRRDALVKVNKYKHCLNFPTLITSDCLAGIKSAYLEACDLFLSNGIKIYKKIKTYFSRDMVIFFFFFFFFLSNLF